MASQWVTVEPGFSRVPGVDPAVEWALGEGADYFFPSENQRQWVPILVQFKEELSESEFESGRRFVAEGWKVPMRVGRVHTADFADRPVRFTTALVSRAYFLRLVELWPDPKFKEAYEKYIARIILGLPLDDDSLPVAQSGEPK
jgi:hypothetical protein